VSRPDPCPRRGLRRAGGQKARKGRPSDGRRLGLPGRTALSPKHLEPQPRPLPGPRLPRLRRFHRCAAGRRSRPAGRHRQVQSVSRHPSQPPHSLQGAPRPHRLGKWRRLSWKPPS
jgi:hypothetical protein